MAVGVVKLQAVAQDGMRVPASAEPDFDTFKAHFRGRPRHWRGFPGFSSQNA